MLTDGAGRRVALGEEIAVGGEGRICAVADAPDLVAKLYLRPLDPARADKLRAMAGFPPRHLARIAAWPREVLVQGGAVVGFLMPRVGSRMDLHNLYVGTARKRHFPKADYRLLVAAAANLARAVAAVHDAGCVIGDVNERMAMVADDATVVLIDADSFQFAHQGRRFTCDVGTPGFQPPELQGGPGFRGLERSRNHDAFGLAVLVFHLLFNGRHPFAGQALDGRDMEPPEAIRNFRFAYAPDAARLGVRPPPHALPFAAIGPELSRLFVRAFGPEGRSDGRPTAESWVGALGSFFGALSRCRFNPTHWHLAGPCHFCLLEAATGRPVFSASLSVRSVPEMLAELEALARQVAATALPPRAPPPPVVEIPVIVPTPYPTTPPAFGFWNRLNRMLGLAEQAVLAETQRRRRALAEAEAELAAALRAWRDDTTLDRITMEKARLDSLLDAGRTIAADPGPFLQQALRDIEAESLRRHLETFDIEGARIPRIGKARKTSLAERGLETAADLETEALRGIPGFGPVIIGALLAWRQGCAARHLPRIFDRRTGEQMARALMSKELQRLHAEMRTASARILALIAEVGQGRDTLRARIKAALRSQAQARADLDAQLA